jgi:hypothetical protein
VSRFSHPSLLNMNCVSLLPLFFVLDSRLEYQVPDPLIPIIHQDAAQTYQQLFLYLFGMKRVELELNVTWRQSAFLQHACQTCAQEYQRIQDASMHTEYAQAIMLLRTIALNRQSMMHFVMNLKSYLMFEVLEGGWKVLVENIETASTIDEIVKAHDDYLDGVRRKSLVVGHEDSNDDDNSTTLSRIGQQINRLLQLASDFCAWQTAMFEPALLAAHRAALKRQEAFERVEIGAWGFVTEEEVIEEESFFGLADPAKLHNLDSLSREFNRQMTRLLDALDKRLNGPAVQETISATTPSSSVRRTPLEEEEIDDVDDDLDSLRFLAFQLDHNKFYSLQHA